MIFEKKTVNPHSRRYETKYYTFVSESEKKYSVYIKTDENSLKENFYDNHFLERAKHEALQELRQFNENFKKYGFPFQEI